MNGGITEKRLGEREGLEGKVLERKRDWKTFWGKEGLEKRNWGK